MRLDNRKLLIIMAENETGVRALARLSGVSAASISNYIRGSSSPTLQSLGKISKGLGIRVTEILQDEETKKEQTR